MVSSRNIKGEIRTEFQQSYIHKCIRMYICSMMWLGLVCIKTIIMDTHLNGMEKEYF